jgi:glycine cleavage system H protein
MRFTKDHEWVELNGEVATVGISAYAAEQLGDVVFVEVPEVGRQVKAGDGFAVVESVKAASDVYAPIAGEVVAVNVRLDKEPGLVNSDPYGDGWMLRLRLRNSGDTDSLLGPDEYAKHVGD